VYKKLTQQFYFLKKMNTKTNCIFQMTNKSKKKASGTVKKTSTKSLPQSRKASTIGKSAASSRASTPASRASIASSQPSRRATVEESEDEDDEASHVGSTLDADGDRTMEPADKSDSESEDDKTELSKTKSVFI